MNIVIVGAGRVATHLALALSEAGETVLQVFSRTLESAEMLAQQLHCKATCRLDEVLPVADLYIISVKDSALPGLAQFLAKHCQGTFVHTAGSIPMSVFPASATHYGVLYPMQTFSKQRPVNFRQVPLFIEASDETTRQLLQSVGCQLSDSVFFLSSEERRHLHLAAVFASNFTNHCYAIAAGILAKHGLPFSCMQPLVEETASKVANLTPLEAQTGPAVRFDENVMSAQEQLLHDQPEWKEIYRLMSADIHRMASSQQHF